MSLRAPTLVLVGAPNVGKSTLVRALSTGEPEVGNYAFTTRGVSLGHVYDGGALAGIEGGVTASRADSLGRDVLRDLPSMGSVVPMLWEPYGNDAADRAHTPAPVGSSSTKYASPEFEIAISTPLRSPFTSTCTMRSRLLSTPWNFPKRT